MSKVAKPQINVLYAQPTNRWSRNGQSIEYIVLHYVGAVSTAKANAVYLNRDGNLGWSDHDSRHELRQNQSRRGAQRPQFLISGG